MASKFLRRLTWWIKFQHPLSGDIQRASLATHDEARAELLRERLELEIALLDPRFQAVDIPNEVQTLLPALYMPAPAMVAASIPMAAPLVPRVPFDEAAIAYLNFIRLENAPRHFENKVSMLRRFIGSARVEKFPQWDDAEKEKRRFKTNYPAFFKGIYIDEINPTLLQKFMDQLDVSLKTKRHYREFFQHFFQHCIKFGHYTPANFHCPNPMAALPSYLSKNRRIVFLKEHDVEKQLTALTPPSGLSHGGRLDDLRRVAPRRSAVADQGCHFAGFIVPLGREPDRR